MKCQNYTLKKTGCTKVAANSNRIEYETTVHYYPYKSKVLNLCENGFLYTFEETLGHESFQSSTKRCILSEFDIRQGLNDSVLFRFCFDFVYPIKHIFPDSIDPEQFLLSLVSA